MSQESESAARRKTPKFLALEGMTAANVGEDVGLATCVPPAVVIWQCTPLLCLHLTIVMFLELDLLASKIPQFLQK